MSEKIATFWDSWRKMEWFIIIIIIIIPFSSRSFMAHNKSYFV